MKNKIDIAKVLDQRTLHRIAIAAERQGITPQQYFESCFAPTKRKPLSRVAVVQGRRVVRTSILVPEELRSFVLDGAKKLIPGTSRPYGIQGFIVSVLANAKRARRAAK